MRTLIRATAPAVLAIAFTATCFGQTASTATLGTGWGVATPQLLATRPVIGQTVQVLAFNCPSDMASYFIISAPRTAPYNAGHGLFVQVEFDSASMFGPEITAVDGSLFLGIPLTLPLSAAGAQIAAQLYIENPDGVHFPFEMTNGLLFTIGVE